MKLSKLPVDPDSNANERPLLLDRGHDDVAKRDRFTRPSNYETDARRRTGRLQKDPACSRWVAPTSFGRHWLPTATVECGRQWSPAVTDGSEEPQVVGSPAHAAGLMPVGDSDCRPTDRGSATAGQQTGSNRCP